MEKRKILVGLWFLINPISQICDTYSSLWDYIIWCIYLRHYLNICIFNCQLISYNIYLAYSQKSKTHKLNVTTKWKTINSAIKTGCKNNKNNPPIISNRIDISTLYNHHIWIKKSQPDHKYSQRYIERITWTLIKTKKRNWWRFRKSISETEVKAISEASEKRRR